jgi:hypothetical protein
MIRVTKSISIEIDAPEDDIRQLLRDIKGHDAIPAQITTDLVKLLEKSLSRVQEGPVYRAKS